MDRGCVWLVATDATGLATFADLRIATYFAYWSAAVWTQAMIWYLFLGTLHLIWQEHNGPAVDRPQRKGFGTILIEGVVSDLGGRVDVDYDPQGLVLKAVVPLPSAQDGMSRL